MSDRGVYEEMLTWPANEQARYLRGFVDGEGGPRFYLYKGQKTGKHSLGDPHVRAVVISNTDLQLLNTAKQMLEGLEIRSKIYIDQRAGRGKAKKDSWVLRIQDKTSLLMFSEKIGFSNPKKKEILGQIIASYRRRGWRRCALSETLQET